MRTNIATMMSTRNVPVRTEDDGYGTHATEAKADARDGDGEVEGDDLDEGRVQSDMVVPGLGSAAADAGVA